jgi:hypothetical protein
VAAVHYSKVLVRTAFMRFAAVVDWKSIWDILGFLVAENRRALPVFPILPEKVDEHALHRNGLGETVFSQMPQIL